MALYEEEFTEADGKYWTERGRKDRHDDKGPLFRNTRSKGIHAVAETPEHWSYEYERSAGMYYLHGYDS